MKSRLNTVYALLVTAFLGAAVCLAPVHAEGEKAAEKDKQPADQEAAGEEIQEVIAVPAQVTAEALRHSGKIVSQTGDLNIQVETQVYDEFPGYDMDSLSEGQRDWLLERANGVYCTCGCRGDTVARCVVLDPTCQTARDMLDNMLARAGRLSREELAAARTAAKASAAKAPAKPAPSN